MINHHWVYILTFVFHLGETMDLCDEAHYHIFETMEADIDREVIRPLDFLINYNSKNRTAYENQINISAQKFHEIMQKIVLDKTSQKLKDKILNDCQDIPENDPIFHKAIINIIENYQTMLDNYNVLSLFQPLTADLELLNLTNNFIKEMQREIVRYERLTYQRIEYISAYELEFSDLSKSYVDSIIKAEQYQNFTAERDAAIETLKSVYHNFEKFHKEILEVHLQRILNEANKTMKLITLIISNNKGLDTFYEKEYFDAQTTYRKMVDKIGGLETNLQAVKDFEMHLDQLYEYLSDIMGNNEHRERIRTTTRYELEKYNETILTYIRKSYQIKNLQKYVIVLKKIDNILTEMHYLRNFLYDIEDVEILIDSYEVYINQTVQDFREYIFQRVRDDLVIKIHHLQSMKMPNPPDEKINKYDVELYINTSERQQSKISQIEKYHEEMCQILQLTHPQDSSCDELQNELQKKKNYWYSNYRTMLANIQNEASSQLQNNVKLDFTPKNMAVNVTKMDLQMNNATFIRTLDLYATIRNALGYESTDIDLKDVLTLLTTLENKTKEEHEKYKGSLSQFCNSIFETAEKTYNATLESYSEMPLIYGSKNLNLTNYAILLTEFSKENEVLTTSIIYTLSDICSECPKMDDNVKCMDILSRYKRLSEDLVHSVNGIRDQVLDMHNLIWPVGNMTTNN